MEAVVANQIDKIPGAWREALNTLHLAGIPAVLAGGAMRDLYCGKPFKDVDIFTLGFDDTTATKIMKAFTGNWEFKSYTRFSRGYDIDFVLQPILKRKTDLPIEIIGTSAKSVNELLDDFDYGLCQIAWTGERVFYTQRFLTDFLNGTFTLTTVQTYDRAIQRYKNWAEEKYKGWKFVPTGIVLREQVIRSLKGNHGKSARKISPHHI
jgi:hypothetical protein